MPHCIVLIGFPGSGKSTWRETFLKTHQDYEVICPDDLVQAYAGERGLTYNDVWDTCRTFVYSTAKHLKQTAIRNKKNIIVDMTNLSVASRNRAKSGLTSDYTTEGVWFNVPMDVCKQRANSRVGKTIDEEIYNSMLQNFVEPTKSEFGKLTVIKS